MRQKYYFIGAAKGGGDTEHRERPPEIEKIVVENGVISEGSIFSNNFSTSR